MEKILRNRFIRTIIKIKQSKYNGEITKEVVYNTGKWLWWKDQIYCIINDNHNKWNWFVEGVLVLGGRDDVADNVKKYDISKTFCGNSFGFGIDKEILEICKKQRKQERRNWKNACSVFFESKASGWQKCSE